jgi:hypothetical protein
MRLVEGCGQNEVGWSGACSKSEVGEVWGAAPNGSVEGYWARRDKWQELEIHYGMRHSEQKAGAVVVAGIPAGFIDAAFRGEMREDNFFFPSNICYSTITLSCHSSSGGEW